MALLNERQKSIAPTLNGWSHFTYALPHSRFPSNERNVIVFLYYFLGRFDTTKARKTLQERIQYYVFRVGNSVWDWLSSWKARMECLWVDSSSSSLRIGIEDSWGMFDGDAWWAVEGMCQSRCLGGGERKETLGALLVTYGGCNSERKNGQTQINLYPHLFSVIAKVPSMIYEWRENDLLLQRTWVNQS